MNYAKTRGMMLNNKRDYVAMLGELLSVMDDFGSIEYANSYVTEQEYIKMSDTIGNVCFMNVTAFSESEILRDVCKVIAAGDLPFSIITDTATKKKIAHLFR